MTERRHSCPSNPFPTTLTSSGSRASPRRCGTSSAPTCPQSIDLVREHHPRLGDLGPVPATTGFKLADAQLTVARMYGFPSWPRLRRHVELVTTLSRAPHRQPVGEALADDAGRADELLRLACLNYGNDSPDRWRAAAELLAEHPELARLVDPHRGGHRRRRGGRRRCSPPIPAAAGRQGGPFGWAPLLYLTYSRLVVDGAGHDHVAVARLLLDHGADPERRVPLGGPAVTVHRPHRRVRAGRAGRAAAPRRARAGPAPAGGRRRGQRQPDDLRPRRWATSPRRHDVPRAAARLRSRPGRRRPVAAAARRGPPDAGGPHGRGAAARRRGRPAGPGPPAARPRRRSRTAAASTRSTGAAARTRARCCHGNLEIAGLLADGRGRRPTGSGRSTASSAPPGRRPRRRSTRCSPPTPRCSTGPSPSGPISSPTPPSLGRADAVRLLVASGFDVNACAGSTALHQAAWAGDVDLARAPRRARRRPDDHRRRARRHPTRLGPPRRPGGDGRLPGDGHPARRRTGRPPVSRGPARCRCRPRCPRGRRAPRTPWPPRR